MKSEWKRTKYMLLLFAASLPMSAGCEVKFGGMSAREAFREPNVAALTEAATTGDIKTMEELIRSGVDVNARGAEGVSPLIWVLAARNKKGVERLLRAGANPNYKMAKGVSAMSLATGGDQPEMLELLLQYGGNPNFHGPRGEPLLHLAALHQRDRQLRILLKAGADINGADNGDTVGNVSAAAGRFDEVAYLLENGLTYNLQELAKSVEIRRIPPGSEQQRWKDKVIEMLKARGVKFPAFVPKAPGGLQK